MSFALLAAWKSWECLSPIEIFVNILVRKFVMLSFVSLKLGNEIDKVLRLLEFLKVLSVNHISQLIFNLNYELNYVKTIKSMLSEI